MKKQHFLHGAAILGAAGIISKLLGAFYRIPFARMVGGEGMGIYQMAYPIYTLALALSTSGLPTALAVMIAEKAAKGEHAAAKKIFRVAFVILSFSGALMSLAIIKAAPFLALHIFHHPASVFAIRAVAPAIFLSSIVSCWRGYFQGYQNMLPTAISQVTEQIIRVITVLVLALYLMPYGVAYAAAGAAFGAVTGGISAAITLGIFASFTPRLNNKNFSMPSSKDIITQLFRLGVPVSLAGLIMPFVQGIDAVIIPGRLLMAGYSTTEAADLYGQLTGMAMTLVNLPVMFTVALAAGVVPVISEAVALKDLHKAQNTTRQAFTALFLLALPSAIGLQILSEPICKLLYNLPQAGEILGAASPIVLAIGAYQVTASILQGMGKMMPTLINLSIGCIIKIIFTYYLVGVPFINILGAAYSTAGGFFIAAILNIIVLLRVIGKTIFKIPLFKILIANLLLVFICNTTYNYLKVYKELVTISGVVSVAFITYFAIVIIFGIIKAKDVIRIFTSIWRK